MARKNVEENYATVNGKVYLKGLKVTLSATVETGKLEATNHHNFGGGEAAEVKDGKVSLEGLKVTAGVAAEVEEVTGNADLLFSQLLDTLKAEVDEKLDKAFSASSNEAPDEPPYTPDDGLTDEGREFLKAEAEAKETVEKDAYGAVTDDAVEAMRKEVLETMEMEAAEEEMAEAYEQARREGYDERGYDSDDEDSLY